MAASLGATSLAHVHHQGLDEILHDLAIVYPTSSDNESQLLGVPVLDVLLEVFMLKVMGPSSDLLVHRSSRQQNINEDEEMLLRGDEQEVELSGLEEADPPSNAFFSCSTNSRKCPPTVLEISSSVSGAGKTQLLYHLTALSVLPRQHRDIPVGGHEAAVVYIDADDRFDAERLRTVARGILQQSQQSAAGESEGENAAPKSLAEDDLEPLVTSSLQHVHVFRPQSSPALLATLSSLDAYLYDLPRHYSASRPLQMIAIDSATAFFWQDRLRDEVARTEDIGRPRAEIDQEREKKQSFYLSDLYAEIVKELKRLQGRFMCAVVYTTTVTRGRLPTTNESGHSGHLGPHDQTPSRTPSLRPALPAPWGTFPTLRLVAHRDTVRPFAPAMSAHDARRDAPMRQGIVRQGKFSAWVNAWGRDDWPRRVVDGIDFHNGGCFSFYVRETGVEIPLPVS